jgi:HK97 gp10 family phage protein
MHFDVSELRALSADLAKADEKVTELATKVVAKVALDIEASAKAGAPVDTGALKNSISSDINGLSAEIGPTISYGVFQEYGTSRMAPQPFMGPAVDANEPNFVSAMGQVGEKIL